MLFLKIILICFIFEVIYIEEYKDFLTYIFLNQILNLEDIYFNEEKTNKDTYQSSLPSNKGKLKYSSDFI